MIFAAVTNGQSQGRIERLVPMWFREDETRATGDAEIEQIDKMWSSFRMTDVDPQAVTRPKSSAVITPPGPVARSEEFDLPASMFSCQAQELATGPCLNASNTSGSSEARPGPIDAGSRKDGHLILASPTHGRLDLGEEITPAFSW